ncbi:MAG: aminoacyl--tRNA ligase-related protein [Candidatus Spechtbacterales bacterium]
MRQSKLFTKTMKAVAAEETSINAQLLQRGGFSYKNSAGVYTHLPLGLRVINRIGAIIREEMNAIDGVEMLMPALVDRKYLDATGRFSVDIGFDAVGKGEKSAHYVLGWTHEEVLTEIASKYVQSWRDLPFVAYQIQSKFRNEARAKSGLLRGREFLMKDMYSFHANEEELYSYYEKVKGAYLRVFDRCGLTAYYTVAAGGDFTASTTHEFQVLADAGEDIIYYCDSCHTAQNEEVATLKEGDACEACGASLKKGKSVEVGNIFPLGTKYSEAFNLVYKNEKGESELVVMGSYGIGVSRLMASIVEVFNDERGIMWPTSVAPFEVHIVTLPGEESAKEADALYERMISEGISVLLDDRAGVSPGEKFADADLIGVPLRITVSARSLEAGGVGVKARSEDEERVLPAHEAFALAKSAR